MNKQIKFDNDDVCACVVTYNPDENTWKNIRLIKPLVGAVIVVDNSGETVHYKVEKNAKDNSCEYLWDGGNKGLAYALNRGFEFAKLKNYKLYLTLDQDSICEKNMINALISCINKNGANCSVGPCWNNELLKEDEEVKYLITSGNMTPIEQMIKIGGFDEDFFIDSLDMDFSLALREEGCRLYKVKNAILKHKIGEIERSKILKIPYLSHSLVKTL